MVSLHATQLAAVGADDTHVRLPPKDIIKEALTNVVGGDGPDQYGLHRPERPSLRRLRALAMRTLRANTTSVAGGESENSSVRRHVALPISLETSAKVSKTTDICTRG